MNAKEKFNLEVNAFALMFLKNFGEDLEKAATALKALNFGLIEHPKMLPFIAKEANQKAMGEIVQVLSTKGLTISTGAKLVKMAQKMEV
jgi:hypothetical protein